MRHNHQLLDHPLFEEKPIKEVLEPFGFEVDVQFHEPPCSIEQPDEADAYARDAMAYIDGLTFEHPHGYTEIYRGDNEDSEIFSVAVRAKTPFVEALLYADPDFDQDPEVTQALLDVLAERQRHVEVEGWTPEHDDEHIHGELAAAAACYAYAAWYEQDIGGLDTDTPPEHWPWDDEWWKPTTPRRDLVKAVALGLAEIERLDRAAARQGGEG